MTSKRLHIRRADACAVCQRVLPVGIEAVWDSDRRTTTCLTCGESGESVVVSGPAGASAKAEAVRRRSRQAERKRQDIEAHPILGRLAHTLAPEPDAGRSWATG